MATGDIYKAQAVFSNSDTGKNLSFGLYGIQAGVLAPLIADVESDIVEWWNSGIGGEPAQKTYHDADVALELVTLQKWDPIAPLIEQSSAGLPVAGTLAGDQYTGQAAILISLRTLYSGRSYRGRAYLPPPGEAMVGANGALAAADALNIAQNFSGLLNQLDTHNFRPVVYSKFLGAGYEITQLYCDRLLRTQRRRQDRATEYQGASV